MRGTLLIGLVIAGSSAASAGNGAPQYSITILPDDSASHRTRAMAINELGQMAGDIALPDGVSNAVFWASADEMHEVIHGPGDELAFANDLNDAGVVVGSAGEGQFAFGWTSGTIYTPLPSNGCCPDALAINEDGTIVGKGNEPTGTFTAVWLEGELHNFGALPGHCCSVGMDVNDLGTIVGSSDGVAALWEEDGRVLEIGGLGGLFATANGVNNRGEVVGEAHVDPPGTTQPFYWNGGPLVELPALRGSAEAINDHGVIVGFASFSSIPGQPSISGAVWINGEVHDLNDLVVNMPSGASITWATDINNAGQIVGLMAVDGSIEAVLLDPIAPDPTDLNGDGLVNAADLALLLGSWGACIGCDADLNIDGNVNAADLALLLGSWG